MDEINLTKSVPTDSIRSHASTDEVSPISYEELRTMALANTEQNAELKKYLTETFNQLYPGSKERDLIFDIIRKFERKLWQIPDHQKARFRRAIRRQRRSRVKTSIW